MAILKGFPPSNSISPTTRIPCKCEYCKKTNYMVCDRNVDGRLRLVCDVCFELMQKPRKNYWLKNHWLDKN